MKRRDLPRTFDELAGLRARGLVRESTVEQGDNSGPIVQRRDQEAFAARWGLILEQRPNPTTGEPEPFLYTDLVSGSDALKRPQFLRMVADAKAGLFDVLLVRDTSRFARNIEQTYGYIAQLHAAGVAVAYTYENQLSSQLQQVGMAVNHALNEEYRGKLATNVQLGYRVHRFEAGKFSGTVPIGYVMEYEEVYNPTKRTTEPRDTGKLLPDVEPRPRIGQGDLYTNADLVRHIGELYASGRYGARSLAVALNLEGYRKADGGPFAGHGVRKFLESPTYAGYLSWHHRADKRQRGETGELVEGAWEPLWSRELWEQITAVRRRQFKGSAGGRARYAYPLRRLAICDRCGGRLFGEMHRDVPYMACTTQRERKECAQHGIKAKLLEDQVGTWLATLRLPDDWRADMTRLQRGIAAAADSRPKVDRSAIEAQRVRLGDLYVMGEIVREEFVGRLRALDASLTVGMPQPTYSEAILVQAARLLGQLAELWTKATTEERQDIAQNLFAWVRVRDDRIVRARLARDEYRPLIASAVANTWVGLAPPDGLEPPTQALGRPRSIH